jgi:hypothetical protein
MTTTIEHEQAPAKRVEKYGRFATLANPYAITMPCTRILKNPRDHSLSVQKPSRAAPLQGWIWLRPHQKWANPVHVQASKAPMLCKALRRWPHGGAHKLHHNAALDVDWK